MGQKEDFCIARIYPGRLNALVKNIMRQVGVNDPNEAVRLMNSGEYIVAKNPQAKNDQCWSEKNGIFYFSSTLDQKKLSFAVISSDTFSTGKKASLCGSPNSFLCDVEEIFNFAERKKFTKPKQFFSIPPYVKNILTEIDFKKMGFDRIIIMSKPKREEEGYLWWLSIKDDLTVERVAASPSDELPFLKGEPTGLLFFKN